MSGLRISDHLDQFIQFIRASLADSFSGGAQFWCTPCGVGLHRRIGEGGGCGPPKENQGFFRLCDLLWCANRTKTPVDQGESAIDLALNIEIKVGNGRAWQIRGHSRHVDER